MARSRSPDPSPSSRAIDSPAFSPVWTEAENTSNVLAMAGNKQPPCRQRATHSPLPGSSSRAGVVRACAPAARALAKIADRADRQRPCKQNKAQPIKVTYAMTPAFWRGAQRDPSRRSSGGGTPRRTGPVRLGRPAFTASAPQHALRSGRPFFCVRLHFRSSAAACRPFSVREWCAARKR